MKKMGILFLLIALASAALSVYFFNQKEKDTDDDTTINKQKGDDFEDYVIQLLGKQADVKFVGKVSDYHKNGVSATENREPDLKFVYKNTAFAVECKWRNAFRDGTVYWAKSYQIQNYISYQNTKKENVYVAIGIGGKPSVPEKLFLVPLYRLTKEFATEGYIREFEVINKAAVLGIIQQQQQQPL